MLSFMSSQTLRENPSKERQSPLILIMSREPDTRFLFKTLLEMWNYRVEDVENSEQLIAAAERAAPSLLIMDTALPFVDNMTQMQQLRKSERFKETPIVLLSGHSQPRFRNLALSLGACEFLVKPIDFDVLRECLKKNIKEKKEGEVL